MLIVIKGRADIQTELPEYDPANIYNMDETGLFYWLEPNATGPVWGKKRVKNRITVSLCVNATGKTFDPYNNKKAWMTSAIYQDWLINFNRSMTQGRQVILLVDNAGSHSSEGIELSNLKVKFLPPNTTAHIQPWDTGIIRNFKANYRQHFVKYVLNSIEEKPAQTVTVHQAMTFVKESLIEVKPTTIVNW